MPQAKYGRRNSAAAVAMASESDVTAGSVCYIQYDHDYCAPGAQKSAKVIGFTVEQDNPNEPSPATEF